MAPLLLLLRVTPLQSPEINEALVLAELSAVDLDAEMWRAETLRLMTDPTRGGVLIARTETGRACGLLHYRIVGDAEARPSLEIQRLVAFALMDPHRIADRLIAEAIRRARLQGCDSLRLVRPLDSPAEASALVLASGLANLHSVF